MEERIVESVERDYESKTVSFNSFMMQLANKVKNGRSNIDNFTKLNEFREVLFPFHSELKRIRSEDCEKFTFIGAQEGNYSEWLSDDYIKTLYIIFGVGVGTASETIKKMVYEFYEFVSDYPLC